MIDIEIDNGSGFCFGVTTAIQKAEEELRKGTPLYCLGDIVHNGKECERLKSLGLITINHEEFKQLHGVKVLLRAHGEPPETYEIARKNEIEIIDATCPVVLRLQQRIKQEYDSNALKDKQIVIYGKAGHAEVLGLVGQTSGKAIVIESLKEAEQLDFSKDIRLYSQTTKSLDEFWQIVEYITHLPHAHASHAFQGWQALAHLREHGRRRPAADAGRPRDPHRGLRHDAAGSHCRSPLALRPLVGRAFQRRQNRRPRAGLRCGRAGKTRPSCEHR